jgi:hypothetical protein
MQGLTPASRVVRFRDLVQADFGNGSLALLGPNADKYYGISDTASRIWSLLENETSIEDICGVLRREYEIDADTCEREVTNFVAELLSEGLARVV